MCQLAMNIVIESMTTTCLPKHLALKRYQSLIGNSGLKVNVPNDSVIPDVMMCLPADIIMSGMALLLLREVAQKHASGATHLPVKCT